MGIIVDTIHADRSQEQRDKVVRAFREGTIPFLICTELMGRGIDFKAVNQGAQIAFALPMVESTINYNNNNLILYLVINYDCPSSKFVYIHHIG